MKGLLLKDFYATLSYLRIFLVIILVFIVGAALNLSYFITLFPCIMASMIAMTLIAYEEQEKWHIYVTTLPVRRSTLVSVKYLDALIIGGGVILLSVLAQAIAMLLRGAFDAGALVELLGIFCPLTLIPSALLLPFVFRFGAARGRLAYYGVIGIFAAVIGFLNDATVPFVVRLFSGLTGGVFAAVSAILFVLSWLLSIRLYRNRES